MAINLLNIKPTQVSTDLSGYITYLYGAPKVGKTTFARDAGALILAAEKGYNALSGAYVQDILSWSEVKAVVRELKKPEVKQTFKMVAVDTVDAIAPLVEKYICQKNGVEALGDVPYGQGWSQFKKEFEDTFRQISMLGYSVLFISHDQEREIKKPNGETYTAIGATVSNSINKIVKAMSDIIGYAYIDPADSKAHLMLRSLDGTVDVGCRFAYIEPVIIFSYNDLQNALTEAVKQEGIKKGPDAITEERKVIQIEKQYDFKALVEKFQNYATILMNMDEKYGPQITKIVSTHLKGVKVKDAKPEQAELIECINNDMEATFEKELGL